MLKVRHEDHNHTPTLRGSHPVHRRLTMTDEMKDQIRIQSRTETRPQQILTHLRLDTNEEDPIIKAQDIYNQRALMRHETLRNLTATQALLRELSNKKY